MATNRSDANGAGSHLAGPHGLSGAGVSADEGRARLAQRLLRHLQVTLSANRGDRLSEDDLRVQLSKLAEQWHDAGQPLDYAEQQAAVSEALSEVFGYGPIDGLMGDQAVTDIFVNGPRQLYFERGGQLHAADVAFRDEEHLMQVIGRMLAASGRRVGATRMVDARLPDGSRVNVVLTPPALNGPLVSVRRFGARPLTVDDLVANESLPREMLDFLSACVRARINLVVSGGTGTGKTTLLNALSRYIPDTERIVTIEDTAELQLQQRHVAKMEAQQAADADGGSEVSMHDLVRNALRMRPDRIIVGESRGAEVMDMLQAMNTGHEGSMTTVHANDPREALSRIELMSALTGAEIPVWAVRRLIAASLQMVVQVARMPGGRRKVVAVTEITGMEGDIVSMQTLFEFVQTGLDVAESAVGYFRATGLRPRCLPRLQARGANVAPQHFAERVLYGGKVGGVRR